MRLEGLLPWVNMICWQKGWEGKEMKMTSRFWPQQLEKWDCHSLRQERLRLYGLTSWSGFGHLEFEWQISEWSYWLDIQLDETGIQGQTEMYISVEMVLKTSWDWVRVPGEWTKTEENRPKDWVPRHLCSNNLFMVCVPTKWDHGAPGLF